MNKINLCKLILFWTLVAAQGVNADFQLGVEHYEAGNLEAAYKEFKQAADYGEAAAQFNLGAMYYRGEFVEKDLIKSYAWLALAEQNNEASDKPLHIRLYEQLSAEEKIQADALLKQFQADYSPSAIEQRLLPNIGNSSNVTTERPLKRVAPEYPRTALHSGISFGIVDVVFTIDQDGITRDHKVQYSSNPIFERSAVEALRKHIYQPAKVGERHVSVNGARNRFIYEMTDLQIREKRLLSIKEELQKNAQSGSGDEKLAYGYFLESSTSLFNHVKPELKPNENPNDWYLDAAKEGNSTAAYFLGRNVLYGNMCDADSMKSMGWLLQAAQKGLVEAQYMLAMESLSGARFEKNNDKAVYWLKKAAEKDDAARLRYAWLLTTLPEASKRNAELAASLVKLVPKDYYDQQTYLETQAAIAAELGDFKAALRWAKRARKDAEKLDIPLNRIDAQIASYKKKEPWREAI